MKPVGKNKGLIYVQLQHTLAKYSVETMSTTLTHGE